MAELVLVQTTKKWVSPCNYHALHIKGIHIIRSNLSVPFFSSLKLRQHAPSS
uniref:Uncharacterized protein n=1 Tax=Anguilla anguilla TaxID=7936 RepID=A0A0E9RZJ0_ANGAN